MEYVSVEESNTHELNDNNTGDTTAHPGDEFHVADDRSDLVQLQPEELIDIILKLRAELHQKKFILSFFESTAKTLAEKRDAVVTVLDLIDNITSIRSNVEDLSLRNIATSARPEYIDKDWQNLTLYLLR